MNNIPEPRFLASFRGGIEGCPLYSESDRTLALWVCDEVGKLAAAALESFVAENKLSIEYDHDVLDMLEGLERVNPIFAANIGSFIKTLQARVKELERVRDNQWKVRIHDS